MNNTKERILMVSLKLFAERGFDAVSTGIIAEKLGITKGALYRHFRSKREIFDSIVERMYEYDSGRRWQDDLKPEGSAGVPGFAAYVLRQFDFWTEDEFALYFRRMVSLEQFKSPEMTKMYQDVIAMGPFKYLSFLISDMIKSGRMNKRARDMGAPALALELYSPLFLSISLSDGGGDREKLKEDLIITVRGFQQRYS